MGRWSHERWREHRRRVGAAAWLVELLLTEHGRREQEGRETAAVRIELNRGVRELADAVCERLLSETRW